MVAVIEGKEEAGGARFIHRSNADPGLILLDCADQHGIPFVWVNDPDELFPPCERR